MRTFKAWHIIAILLLTCSSFKAIAKELAQQGTSIEDIVPEGWLHHEAWGDLNKDGIKDLVVVATPDDEEDLLRRDDGYVYNFNPPILAIYFGNGQVQQLWKRYDYVIPPDQSENCSHDIVLEITSRGALRIAISLFCDAGSYGTSTDTYTYRYQDSDFFLIGMDREEMMRNTGECTTVSENYLAWKRQVTKSNAFDDTAPDTEKWSRLKKKPLEKLGAREL